MTSGREFAFGEGVDQLWENYQMMYTVVCDLVA